MSQTGNSIDQQSFQQPTAASATNRVPIKSLVAVVIVVAIIATVAYFLLASGSKQISQKGSANSPYSPSLGYQGAGYYNILGKSTYISNKSQLDSALSPSNASVSSPSSTIQSTSTYNTQSTTPQTTISSTTSASSSSSTSTIQTTATTTVVTTTLPSTTINSQPPFHEQMILSFEDPSYTSLAVKVEAVNQTIENSSVGPSYLLNGGIAENPIEWYQVGLDYNWTGAGGFELGISQQNETGYDNGDLFARNQEVHFNGPVNPGDYVELSLNIQNNKVIFSGTDLNTGASASYNYSAFGATAFSGQASDGFFTGLMSEETYYPSQFSDQKQVNYILITKPNKYSLSASALRYNGQEIETYTGNEFITGARGLTETANLMIYPVESASKYLLFSGNSVKLGNSTLSFKAINEGDGALEGILYLNSNLYTDWFSNMTYPFSNIPFSERWVFKNQSGYVLPYFVNVTFGPTASSSYAALEIFNTGPGISKTVSLGGNITNMNGIGLHIYAFTNDEYNTSYNTQISTVFINRNGTPLYSPSLFLGLQRDLTTVSDDNFSNAFLVNVTCVYPPGQAKICAN